jgi:hypothetical protein
MAGIVCMSCAHQPPALPPQHSTAQHSTAQHSTGARASPESMERNSCTFQASLSLAGSASSAGAGGLCTASVLIASPC